MERAATVAIAAARAAMEPHPGVTGVRFVLFDAHSLAAFQQALG